MIERWMVTTVIDAGARFSKICGYVGMKRLVAALEAHAASLNPNLDAARKAVCDDEPPLEFNRSRDDTLLPHHAKNATKSFVYARFVFSAREARAYASATSASSVRSGAATFAGVGRGLARAARGALADWVERLGLTGAASSAPSNRRST